MVREVLADRGNFVNRELEQTAFLAALADHFVDSELEPDDLSGPRRNVLVFHGRGGIGKTKLLQHLVERTPDIIDKMNGGHAVITRMDLAQMGGAPIEQLILALRADLAGKRIPTAAFDLALLSFWEERHPGEDLSNALRSAGLIRRAADELRLKEELSSNIATILEESAGAAAGPLVRATRAGTSKAREMYRKRRLTAELPALQRLLDTPATLRALSEYPRLLTPELRKVAWADRPRWVVFLDNFQSLRNLATGDRTNEWLIQRVVDTLPDVLFVLFSHYRLDWDDPAVQCDINEAGPDYWPTLAATAPDDVLQLLVPGLTESHSTEVIAGELRDPNIPPIDPSLFREIVARAQGWPMYLRVAAERVRSAALRGSVVDVRDLGAFPELVGTIMDSLPEMHRDLMRAAALLDSFDEELLTATAGLRTHGPTERFLAEANLVDRTDADLPFSVHDIIRGTVRKYDRRYATGWGSRDWSDACTRAFRELERRFSNTSGDRPRLAILRFAYLLMQAEGMSATWVHKGLMATGSVALAAEQVPAVKLEGTNHSWADWLAALVHARAVPPDEPQPDQKRADQLRDLLATPAPSEDLRRTAQRWLGYAERTWDMEKRPPRSSQS